MLYAGFHPLLQGWSQYLAFEPRQGYFCFSDYAPFLCGKPRRSLDWHQPYSPKLVQAAYSPFEEGAWFTEGRRLAKYLLLLLHHLSLPLCPTLILYLVLSYEQRETINRHRGRLSAADASAVVLEMNFRHAVIRYPASSFTVHAIN